MYLLKLKKQTKMELNELVMKRIKDKSVKAIQQQATSVEPFYIITCTNVTQVGVCVPDVYTTNT